MLSLEKSLEILRSAKDAPYIIKGDYITTIRWNDISGDVVEPWMIMAFPKANWKSIIQSDNVLQTIMKDSNLHLPWYDIIMTIGYKAFCDIVIANYNKAWPMEKIACDEVVKATIHREWDWEKLYRDRRVDADFILYNMNKFIKQLNEWIDTHETTCCPLARRDTPY